MEVVLLSHTEHWHCMVQFSSTSTPSTRIFEYLDVVHVCVSKQNILFLKEEEEEEDGINGYHKRKVKDKREILHSDPMPWALHRTHRYAHPVTLRTYNVTWHRGMHGPWNDRSKNQFGRSARSESVVCCFRAPGNMNHFSSVQEDEIELRIGEG